MKNKNLNWSENKKIIVNEKNPFIWQLVNENYKPTYNTEETYFEEWSRIQEEVMKLLFCMKKQKETKCVTTTPIKFI